MIRFRFSDGLAVDWNGSSTFNVYRGGKNVDCFTRYGDDEGGPMKSQEDARLACISWMDENYPYESDIS